MPTYATSPFSATGPSSSSLPPSTSSSPKRISPEERPLPGSASAYSYPTPRSPSRAVNMLAAPGRDTAAVSPKVNKKEPFRPVTKLIPKDPAVQSPTFQELALQAQPSLPPTPSTLSAPQSRAITPVSPRPPVTPVVSRPPTIRKGHVAETVPEDPATKTARKDHAASAGPSSPPRSRSPFKTAPRPASPTKQGPSVVAKATPAAVPAVRHVVKHPQAPMASASKSTRASRPPLASTSTVEAPEPRSSSPVKIRAKVTDGISSPRHKLQKMASTPNLGGAGRKPLARGLGITMETIGSNVESDADLSSADDSFDLPRGPSSAEAVSVHLRLRPLPVEEASAWISSSLTSSVGLEPSLAAGRFAGGGTHYFDAVHTGSSNEGLYKGLARPLISSVLSGFNALIFAYGQTASGKTFTLSGDESSGVEGITQMAVKDLFKGIRSSRREREWLLRCSWIEVYNEGVKDLLEPSNAPQVRASTSQGTTVSPLAEVIVTTPSAVFALLEKGQQNRHVNATDWNERSSRSHTAFKIVVESWARGDGEAPVSTKKGRKVRVSELVLVDLAGSERYVTKGGQERRTEGANINKSLLTLGKVIFALSDKTNPAATQHIPYRDSKLTRILQNSLSGNSKIAVVATLNQTHGSIEESLSTINFAKRIKKVRISAKLNEIDAPDSSDEAQALLLKYRTEADSLRQLVKELQDRESERSEEGAGTGSTAGGNAADPLLDARISELEGRLSKIGKLVVRGEGSDDSSDEEQYNFDSPLCTPRATEKKRKAGPGQDTAVSSSRLRRQASHIDFAMPSTALRQQLHNANMRITSLQTKLSSQPAAAPPRTESDKDALIAALRKELAEAEIALEATALQPLPKVREEVEAEFLPRIAGLEKELSEAKALNEDCLRECERLQRVNTELVSLAHKETREMVDRLREEAGGASPVKPQSLAMPSPGAAMTPTLRRLKDVVGTPPSNASTPRQRPKSVLGDLGIKGLNQHHNIALGLGSALRGAQSPAMLFSLGSPSVEKTPTSPSKNVKNLKISTPRGGSSSDATRDSASPLSSSSTKKASRAMNSESDEENIDLTMGLAEGEGDESALLDI